MFWKLTVSVPCVQGQTRINQDKRSGHRYVEYEVGRNYDKEKNVSTRKTIDILDGEEVSERQLVRLLPLNGQQISL